MKRELPSRGVSVGALLTGAIPLAFFYLAQPGRYVFQEPFSLTGLILAALSVSFPLIRPSWWRLAGLGVFGGSVGVSIVYIVVTGAGNLWPMAIALTAFAAAVPIATGTGVGWLLGSLFHRLRRKA